MLNDAVSIPEISFIYVLYKALEMKEPGDPDLYAPGNLVITNAMITALE